MSDNNDGHIKCLHPDEATGELASAAPSEDSRDKE